MFWSRLKEVLGGASPREPRLPEEQEWREALAAAEQRAAALGCGQLELSSSLKREGAHRFYLAQGYCERPKRFVKAV